MVPTPISILSYYKNWFVLKNKRGVIDKWNSEKTRINVQLCFRLSTLCLCVQKKPVYHRQLSALNFTALYWLRDIYILHWKSGGEGEMSLFVGEKWIIYIRAFHIWGGRRILREQLLKEALCPKSPEKWRKNGIRTLSACARTNFLSEKMPILTVFRYLWAVRAHLKINIFELLKAFSNTLQLKI